MTTLALTLLGSFQATLAERPLGHFRTNKVQALLIYLAAEALSVQQRDRLLELLWPGLPQSSARVNLRQTIYQLRKALPNDDDSFLLADRQTVQINPDYPVTVDVAEFSALLGRSRRHTHSDLLSCLDCQAWLESAMTFYQGPFLADFHLEDSDVFEEWALRLREAYRRQAMDTLGTLADMVLRNGDYRQAEARARQQLEIDEYDERATRQLMEALARNGQRHEALAVYDEATLLLRDELSMAPSSQTAQLAELIRADTLEVAAPKPTAVRGYKLLDEIGAGAFGVVHRAYQPVVGREVAIKVIRPVFANNPDFIRRFETEAQTVARLEHPHIVPLYDYWREPDNAYLVMRWLRGGNLEHRLQGQPLPLNMAATVVDQVAAALQAAHRQHIIHRDVKPANILLDDDDNAYLSDFSVAKDLLTNEMPFDLSGSPDTISPEQLLKEDLSPQTDQYSLGIVIYQMLTGRPPFPQDSPPSAMRRHILTESLPPLAAQVPGLPQAVDDVLRRATAKKPGDRFPDMISMARAFHRAVGTTGVGGSALATAVVTSAVEKEATITLNPYKGLRAFQEGDAGTFFGREALVERLVMRLEADDSRFLTVVGPSGSGKSSAVKAGLLPALRAGTIPHSDNWFITEMTPGRRPMEELETALMRVAVDPPAGLLEPLAHDSRGLIRVLKRILPRDNSGATPQLVLVIDQFEELYTLTDDEDARQHFIDSLLAALEEPDSRLRVVATLRADFYDRPLQAAGLGQLLRAHTEVVLPLTPAELEQAIVEPAALAGVGLEPGLLAAVTADVIDQPGTLPLMQYALTELFEQRDNGTMTHEAYQSIGGVTGALGSRAGEIYHSLEPDEQEAAHQIFLRLVTLGEGVEDTRRRVLRAELEALNIEDVNMDATADGGIMGQVIDTFGQYRLLSFDRDPATRGPTVEVAHEALLREWDELRLWLDEGRADVRLQRLLAGETAAWQEAGGDDDSYLLHGARLEQYDGWIEQAAVSLTAAEAAYLAASLAARDERLAEEEAQRQRELAAVQQLADTERQRAEEQEIAAASLRRRATMLGGLLVVAAMLAGAAVWFARSSDANAAEAVANLNVAATSEAASQANAALAIGNANIAATREMEAEANAELAAANAELASTRESEALVSAGIAAIRQGEAEAEANARATAEAETAAQRDVAQEQARLAISRELSLAADSNLEIDPERSILLALQALSTTHTKAAEEVLHRGLQASRALLTLPASDESVWAVAYSPDGSLLATVGDSNVQVWDAATGELLHSLPFDAQDPHTQLLTFDESGAQLASIDRDEDRENIIFTQWDTLSGDVEQTATWPIVSDDWSVNALSPDLSTLAHTYEDGSAGLWDVVTGEQLVAFPAHEAWVPDDWAWTTQFSPDGSRLAVSGIQGTVTVWDVPASLAAGEGQAVASFVTPNGNNLVWIALNSDGSRLALAFQNNDVELWDLSDTGAPLVSLSEAGWSGLDFSPDDTMLAVGDSAVVNVFDLPGGEQLFSLAGHDANVNVLEFSPDGLRLATAGQDGTVRVWDVRPNADGELLTYPFPLPFPSFRTVLSPDEQLLAVGSVSGPASLLDASTGQLTHMLPGNDREDGTPTAIYTVAFHPDGSRVATVGEDNVIRIWDIASGDLLLDWTGHEPGHNSGGFFLGVIDVAYGPDGTRLATAGTDGVAKVWDAETAEELLVLEGHTDGLHAIAYSPDGNLIATSSDEEDTTVKVWDAETGEEIYTLEGHPIRALGLTFSPNSSLLASNGWAGVIKLWDMATGEEMYTFPSQGSTVVTVDFTPDSQKLVSGGGEALRVFDVATGEELVTLAERSWYVDVSNNGRYVYAGSRPGGFLRVFAIELEDTITLARERLTRGLTEAECQEFLHLESCPTVE